MENEIPMDPVVKEDNGQYRLIFPENSETTDDIKKVLSSGQNTALNEREQGDVYTGPGQIIHIDHDPDDDENKNVWEDITGGGGH